jgi:hypothetical protein
MLSYYSSETAVKEDKTNFKADETLLVRLALWPQTQALVIKALMKLEAKKISHGNTALGRRHRKMECKMMLGCEQQRHSRPAGMKSGCLPWESKSGQQGSGGRTETHGVSGKVKNIGR